MSYRIFKPLAVAAVVFAIAGCASNQELQTLRGEVDGLKADVAAAQADAAEAKVSAQRAEQAAEGARMQSMETNEKIDRMFKQSMYK